ncbi:RAQPRD family integrative conjugative element protein [Vibrio sp. PNB22_3_1]
MRNFFMLFVCLLVSTPASSGVWEERALLERYLEQSRVLKRDLLGLAESSQDPNARIRFDYQALKADLEVMESKVEHYLDSPMSPFELDAVSRVESLAK